MSMYRFALLTRKSRHTFCPDLLFEENGNQDTTEKIDGQKSLGVSDTDSLIKSDSEVCL